MAEIKILIGEESREIALKCYNAASKFGYNAKICTAVENALFAEIQNLKPDFVLCSAFMAEGGAAGLIKRTKRIGKEPFFIVTSTYKNFDTEKEIMAFLNAYFILEPFELSALVNSIQRMVEYNMRNFSV